MRNKNELGSGSKPSQQCARSFRDSDKVPGRTLFCSVIRPTSRLRHSSAWWRGLGRVLLWAHSKLRNSRLVPQSCVPARERHGSRVLARDREGRRQMQRICRPKRTRVGQRSSLACIGVVKLYDRKLTPPLIESLRRRTNVCGGQPSFPRGARERSAHLHVGKSGCGDGGCTGKDIEELVAPGFSKKRFDQRAGIRVNVQRRSSET